MKRFSARRNEDVAGLAAPLLTVISLVLALLVVLRMRALVIFDSLSAWCGETGGAHTIAFHACVLCNLAAFIAVLAALALINLGLRAHPVFQARVPRR